MRPAARGPLSQFFLIQAPTLCPALLSRGDQHAKIDETNAENGKLAKENELLADYIDSPHTSDR
jgi:hypothetical protein